MHTILSRTVLAGVAAAFAIPSGASAAALPHERVTVVVPYSPGNGLDQLGREFADELQKQSGVTFVVENREGAAGLVGTQYAARAKADGQTLLFTANPPFATAPFAVDQPSYDPLSSLTPVTRVGSVPLALVIAPRWSINNLEELSAFVKAHPADANYASAGLGSPGQIYGETLNQAMGLALTDVPYRATGQALTDVMAGNVLVSFVSVPAVAPHVQGGRLRMLAVGSAQRIPDFPDVPTLSEALGQPELLAGVWYGFFVPTGTGQDRILSLHELVAKAAASPRMQAFMQRTRIVPELLDPTAFSRQLALDVGESRRLVEGAKRKE